MMENTMDLNILKGKTVLITGGTGSFAGVDPRTRWASES